MVKDFVFIEEGSVDQYNMLKLLENSGLTNDNVIRYKQGSPKPELVSVKTDDKIDINEIRSKAVDECRDYLMDNLFKFIDKIAIKHSFRDEIYRQTLHNMQINETPESFVNKFKEFLNNDK